MKVRNITLEGFQSYRERETLDLDGHNLVAIVGRNHTGKCLPGDTPVWDPKRSEMLPLEQFVREKRTTTLGFTDNRVAPVPVSAWHSMGVKDVVRIRLEDGSEITTAKTHPILTDRGCVVAGDLAPGAWVGQASHLPSGTHARLTEDEAFILGAYLGDGCMTTRFATFCCADAALLDRLQEAVARTFPGASLRAAKGSISYYIAAAFSKEDRRAIAATVVDKMRDSTATLPPIAQTNWRHIERTSMVGWDTLVALEDELGWDLHAEKVALFPRRAFAEWFTSLGVENVNSHTKRIPGHLLLMPKRQVAAMVEGLWSTDGWISEASKSRAATYTTVSRGLAEDVRKLLLVLGVHTSLTVKRVGESAAYTVSVTQRCWARFSESVTLVGRKDERLRAHLLKNPGRPSWRLGMIPPSFNHEGMSRRSTSGRDARSKGELARHAMNPEVFLDFGGDPKVVEAEVFWCRVVSVEAAGAVECFDLTVDTPEHLFIADTFIVHNSTIFNALEFALWGRSRGPVVADVISRGLDRTEVTVEFDLAGTSYRLVRSRTRKGRHEVMLSVADDTMENGWRELTEKNPMQADPFITELLGMDATVARATWVVGQGDFGSFCEMDPAPRRRLLTDTFGLGVFTRLAEQSDIKRKRSMDERDKATWKRDSLSDRCDALAKGTGPLAERSDAELAEDATRAEAEAEAVAAELESLDDPALEHKATEAQQALADFEADHATRAARHDSEVARLSADLAQATTLLQRAETALEEAEGAGWEVDDAQEAHQKARAEVERLEAALSQAQATVSDLRSRHAAVLAEQRAITAQGQEINERRGPLEASLAKGEGHCFTCGQSLTHDQAQTLIHDQDNLKDLLRQQHFAKGEEAAALGTQGQKAEAEVQSINADLTRARNAERAAERAATDLATLAASADERGRAVDEAKVRVEAVTKAHEALGEPPVRDEKRHKALVTARDKAAAALAKATGSMDARAALEARRDSARAAMRAAWAEQQRRVQVAEELAEVTPLLAKADEDLERLTKDVRTYEVLFEGFKPSGIPSMILAGIIEELNEEANDILANTGADGLGVLVSTQRETQKGNVEEKVMVYAITVDGQVDYSTLSGSEKFRLALAIRLALARCIARRTGTPIETIIVDEGWGALDAETQKAVQDVFMRLSKEFSILTISHIEDVASAFPTLVEVDMATGTSRTSVTTR